MGRKSTVLSFSPAIYLRTRELSGTSATDDSGNGRNGTYSNITGTLTGVTLNQSGPGGIQTGASFDGSSGYLGYDASPVGNISSSSAVSMEGWFNFTTTTADLVLFGLTSSASNNPLLWARTNGLSPKGAYLQYRNDAGTLSGTTSGASGGTLNDGNWHQVGLSFNGADGAMKLYVDGAQVGSTVTSTVGATTLNRFTIAAGRRTTTGMYMPVKASEICVFPSLLSDANFLSLYNSISVSDSSFPWLLLGEG